MKKRVLIIDDELSICVTLMMALEDKYEAEYAMSAEEGLIKLQNSPYNLILLDLCIGDCDGLDVLEKIKAIDKNIEVIVITAYGTVDSAVAAMKSGAFTYMMKPLRIDELSICIEQALSFQTLHERVEYLSDELYEKNKFGEMVGKSPAMKKIYELIEKIKDTDVGVTISGESGTGKELVARAIHYSGKRKEKPFVAVNCAAIPEGLLEEELFGHKKGAFTGAISDKDGKFKVANQGTIFLDEIGDMPLNMQSKILRVLQDKAYTPVGSNTPQKIDVRVIAATNRNLMEMVDSGTFRLDLYYRLHVVGIQMPPLRERKQDIPLLCRHFIEKHNHEHNRNVLGISKAAEQFLMAYNYPGNIRELSNLLEFGVVVCDGDIIEEDDLKLQIGQKTAEKSALTMEYGFHARTIKDMERELIIRTLHENGGHQKRTAEQLGISVRGLRNKIQSYGIKDKNM